MTGRPLRILVTGSRAWADADTITAALLDTLAAADTDQHAVLVHGRCPHGGADLIADQVWRQWAAATPSRRRGPAVLDDPEQHPLDRYPSARARNQAMVDAGADICLAFATSWASGTGMCARMARRARIRTVDYGVDTRPEARP